MSRVAMGWCVLLVGLVGCEQKSSISGAVTYNGTAVELGAVTLIPMTSGKTLAAPIANGQYKLAEAETGKYVATVTGTRKLNHLGRPTGPTAPSAVSGPVDYIAAEAQGNSREIEIKPGAQVLDFTITGDKSP